MHIASVAVNRFGMYRYALEMKSDFATGEQVNADVAMAAPIAQFW